MREAEGSGANDKGKLPAPADKGTTVRFAAAAAVFAVATGASGGPFVINDDGGWCWFQDERVIVHAGKLWVASVATGREDEERSGNVEVAVYNPESGDTERFVLHENLHRNDHATPALLALPDESTRIFAGDEKNIAWPADLHLDGKGRPVAVYSVQVSDGRLPYGDPDWGQDLRYRYARWDGERWHDYEIARAGTRLYPGEDDYTGLICLDPMDTETVVISADVDPGSGKALSNNRYQLFRGRTKDGGQTWEWEQLTEDEDADNLRPVIPLREDNSPVPLVWMRGHYHTYTDYELEMVGDFLSR